MKRLYQSLSELASFFRTEASGGGISRTVCTEVTVRREGMTLQIDSAATAAFRICPLCGTEFAPAQAEPSVTDPEGTVIPMDSTTARRLV